MLLLGSAQPALAQGIASGQRNCGSFNVVVHSQASGTVRHYVNDVQNGEFNNFGWPITRSSTSHFTSGIWVVTSTGTILSAWTSCANMN